MGGGCHYYPCLTENEIVVWRHSISPPRSQLVRGGVGIQALMFGTRNSFQQLLGRGVQPGMEGLPLGWRGALQETEPGRGLPLLLCGGSLLNADEPLYLGLHPGLQR